MGYRMGRPPGRGFDEYYKAYSVAMLPGKERDNVSYGGKSMYTFITIYPSELTAETIVIMPPSALATLSSMELETPAWMFKLQNATNPAASTHAGVLEFIAEEGCVHLPHWMMQTLRLEEGDPIRLNSCNLQKGKFVKLQAQSTLFLEISDPKAVCVIMYSFMHHILTHSWPGLNKPCGISRHSLKATLSRYRITR